MKSGLALVLCAALALGACSGDKKDEGAGKAEGEILPGSTSDAMLPYDTVRSQPPLAPKAVASDKSEKAEVAEAPAEPAATPEASTEAPAEPAD